MTAPVASPAGLLEILREKGTPLGPWGDAVASVSRELFLPDEIEVGDEPVSRSTSPARWLEVAYSDVYPAFTRSRNPRPARGFLDDFLHHREAAEATTTGLSPLRFAQDPDALFYAGLALPDAWHLAVLADDGSGEMTLWILADDRASWASADYTPDGRGYAVTQYGPRRLWDEAEAAYRTWEALGSPTRDRAGLSVTAHGQQVWLDTPGHGLSALTDAPRRRWTGG